jgi:hypothetical protein
MRNAILIASLLSCSVASAQGTAPPTPETTPPQGPAPQAEMSEMKSKLQSMYDEFRNLKNRLPFSLGAGVYLFYYQPLDYTMFSPTDRTGYFQVYAFYLKLDSEWHGFGGHAEVRMRDGGHIGAGSANQYLRGFFSSNIWFQELYAYYRPWNWLDVKAGKIYRKVGIFWDDSFFGNLQYFDGNKLVPDWGLSIEGAGDLAHGKLALEYSAQYFYNSSGTNGSLDYARTFGPAPDTDTSPNVIADSRNYSPTAAGITDSAGNRIGQLKHVVDGRVALSVKPIQKLYFTLGVSGLNARVVRSFKNAALLPGSKGTITDESMFSQAAGELTLGVGPFRGVTLRLQAEYLRQFGPGMRDTDYVLVGARMTWKALAIYLNNSYAHYQLNPAVDEYIIQPGISYAIGGGLAALVEYDEWQRRDPRGVALWNGTTSTGYYSIDRSLNVVLVYAY